MPNVEVGDLNKSAIKHFRKKSVSSLRLTEADADISDGDLIANLKLKEGKYLKRAAILLFHEDPDEYIFGSFVKIAYFRGAEIVHQDEIHGPLISMPDKVMENVYLKYFKGLVTYQGIQRVEIYPVPMSAFREALLNAIIHKDYSSNNPIQIKIYDDKIIVGNSGRLPAEWTLEDLYKPHVSVPRNPLLANTFFRSGMIEAWGRGIERMNECLLNDGNPSVEYRYSGSDIMAVFNVHPMHIEYNRRENDRINGRINDRIKLSKSAKNALDIISKNPAVTVTDLAVSLGKAESTVNRILHELKKKWVNKTYRLTQERLLGGAEIVPIP